MKTQSLLISGLLCMSFITAAMAVEKPASPTEDLWAAASTGDIVKVKELLDKGADVNARTKKGGAALMLASQGGHTDIATLLLDRGADVNATMNDGRTALIVASQRGHTDMASLLLDRGADVNAVMSDGVTVLMVAASMGHTDTARLLLDKGADVNAKAQNGVVALVFASQRGDTDTVRLLLDRGADVNAAMNDGMTVLMLAALDGHTDTARLLLDKGADVNAKAQNGGTALMLAAKGGHTDIVRLLLNRGADVSARTKNGRTASAYAEVNGYIDILNLLKQTAAKVGDKNATSQSDLMFKGHLYLHNYSLVDDQLRNKDLFTYSNKGEAEIIDDEMLCGKSSRCAYGPLGHRLITGGDLYMEVEDTEKGGSNLYQLVFDSKTKISLPPGTYRGKTYGLVRLGRGCAYSAVGRKSRYNNDWGFPIIYLKEFYERKDR